MARDRPGHYNPEMSGRAAFEAALKPQEGQFMRGATYILNTPKDLSGKPSRNPNSGLSDNERVAQGLVDRNAAGQFVKRS